MILPVMIYGLGDETRGGLLDMLSRVSKAQGVPFQVQLCTQNIDDAIALIQHERGVSLHIVGISGAKDDPMHLGLRLGRYAMQVNRSHYVVYAVKERGELEQLLPYCARSAGVIVCPPQEKAIAQVFTPIFEDYKKLYGQEDEEDGGWLNLKTEGKVYRVRMKDVCTVQAINKEIEFKTMKQAIRIYSSMAAAEKMLDKTFIRCHRSYFINSNRIQFVDFRQMCIRMMDGTVIPLARSFKEKLSEGLEQRA